MPPVICDTITNSDACKKKDTYDQLNCILTNQGNKKENDFTAGWWERPFFKLAPKKRRTYFLNCILSGQHYQ